MTTTQVLTDQTIGTGSNIGGNLFPQKVTLAVASIAASISIRCTNGAGLPADIRAPIVARYAFSPVSVAAAAAPGLLGIGSRYLNLHPQNVPSGDTSSASLLSDATGAYLYVWFEVPPFLVAASLNAFVVEL